jgi:hypothetical protein
MRAVSPARSILLLCALAACSDPVDTDPPVRLVIETQGELHTLLTGDWKQLSARAVTASGRDAGPVSVTWSTDNSRVASIDQRGDLRVASTYTACNWVAPGECQVRVTARSADLTGEALITIMPYTAVLSVGARQLDLEMGDTVRLHTRVTLEGRDVPWCVLSFVSQNPSIARVDPTQGVITSADDGSTKIDVTVSGPACPTNGEAIRIINRPPWHTLTILPDVDDPLLPGATLQLIAQVRNGKGVEYPAIVATWSSSDPSVATVENGLVRAVGCAASPCEVTITARSGKLTATTLIVVE